MSDTASQGEVDIAIDAHVHIYDLSLAAEIFHRAAANFANFSAVASRIGVLLLAESSGLNMFSRLHAEAGDAHPPHGSIRTSEDISLWLRVGDWRLLVIAGRQIVTEERLEVLALCTGAKFDEGLPALKLLDVLAKSDAITVLPWGVGKWLGRRRRLVERAIAHREALPLFLGDNGNRPAFWRVPLFKAERHRVKVLAGSDPLPLAGHHKRIGTFGSIVQTVLSDDHPAADLRSAICDPKRPLRHYGKLAHPIGFLRDQIELRLARHARIRAF